MAAHYLCMDLRCTSTVWGRTCSRRLLTICHSYEVLNDLTLGPHAIDNVRMLEYTKQKKNTCIQNQKFLFVCLRIKNKKNMCIQSLRTYVLQNRKKEKYTEKKKKKKKENLRGYGRKKTEKKPYARLPAPLRAQHASSPLRESERD